MWMAREHMLRCCSFLVIMCCVYLAVVQMITVQSVTRAMLNARRLLMPANETSLPWQLDQIDCQRLIDGDRAYISEAAIHRVALFDENHQLNTSCGEIRKRVLPYKSLNNGYPIAFSKVVHTDYFFLEQQLAFTYSEENWYCFALDKRSSVSFRRKLKALSTCLPNVLLSHSEDDSDSTGHDQSQAHLDCLRRMEHKHWEYVILMNELPDHEVQNHDIIVKTNDELAMIFQALNGTNDIEYEWCPEEDCPSELEANLGKLDLCPKHLNRKEARKCRAKNVTWGKGAEQVSLTKKTVSYILNEINVNPLLTQLNRFVPSASNEILLQTLTLTKELRIPGGAIHWPRYGSGSLSTPSNFITRFSRRPELHDCPTTYEQHVACILGVEDLAELSRVPQILANTVRPSFDYGIIKCIGELLFNRSQGIRKSDLQLDFYANLHTKEVEPVTSKRKIYSHRPWIYRNPERNGRPL